MNAAQANGTETDWGTETNWAEAEANFQRAKQALLDSQQQHMAAAQEFLLARAQVRQMLEAVFPSAEEYARGSVSQPSRPCHETMC